MQGVIIENISNIYKVKIEDKTYNCVARGKLKKVDDISPVVGDYVDIGEIDEKNMKGIIESIYKRKTYVKRPKIANLSQIIFVLSSNNPKPDLLMLDKQLTFAEYLSIKPIIILNKIDLDKSNSFIEISNIYESIGYTVIKTNAKEKIGIEKLKNILYSNISAFSGNSGVGKSTLINSLFDKNVTVEGEISNKNKRGKNTTTTTKLYEIDKNTYLADTPGFSTFDINEIESKDLYKYFIEFNKYIQDCEYVGCSHIKERVCGIKKAIDNKQISDTRYQNYIKIYNELKDKEEHKW